MAAFILPALSLGAGLFGDAFSSSGKQGSQQSLTTEKFDTSSNNIQRALEDPAFASFRNWLIPMVQQEMGRAQQPIYGDAQKAAFMNQLNDLATSSMKQLQGQMARSGALRSGRFMSGMNDILLGKNKQAAGFFANLPFQEAQARSERLNPLMSLAASWTGRPTPTMVNSGTQSGNSTRETTMNQYGPSFMKSLASTLSGMGGTMFGDFLKSKGFGSGGSFWGGSGGGMGDWGFGSSGNGPGY